MTVLLVQIPSRPRLQARGMNADASGLPNTHTTYGYVLSRDGITVDRVGRCAASLLPKAQQIVAVLSDTDVAWHSIVLPKAPAARLGTALSGVLEEALLDDSENSHLALAPDAVAGQATWVAAIHRPWLQAHLAELEKNQNTVDRVVPSSWPDAPAMGHFSLTKEAEQGEGEGNTQVQLTWSHPQGVAVLPLSGGLSKTLLPSSSHADMRWSATAAAATQAERWLGGPVTVLTPEQRSLQAARTLWNLRQFDLTPSRRGSRWILDAWRAAQGPQWRPVRVGLTVLVAAQVLGLNLWANHLNSRLQQQRQQLTTVLQTEFPQVRAVLDAPLQMESEVQRLRLRAGQTSSSDLEPLLIAAASGWPSDRSPAQDLSYTAGALTLAASGWSPAHIDQFTNALRAGGWRVEPQESKLVVRAAPPVATQAGNARGGL
jgi:general secretion pathway protein L